MKVQDSPVFRKFWYVAARVDDLKAGPRPFSLFGEDLVIWQAADGTVAAHADHCCHRSARLSLGEVVGNRLACPYHGWQFAVSGQCELIPQMPGFTPPAASCVKAYRVQVRYGLVWVALEQPLADVPQLDEAERPGWRLIHEFHEVWDMSLFRLVDNWFDMAHTPFVHRAGQGDVTRPEVPDEEIEDSAFGVVARSLQPIANRADGQAYTGIDAKETTRDRVVTWFAPNSRRLRIGFPNGLQHIIFTSGTPIAEKQILFTQLVIRNDTEADVPAATAIGFDRRVTLEDKLILESTLADVPIMNDEVPEQGMKPDRAQMHARRKLRELVIQYDPSYRRAA